MIIRQGFISLRRFKKGFTRKQYKYIMESPLMLLTIGMITVFTVLILIVLSGNALTYFVNKYIPEEQKVAVKPSATSPTVIDGNKLAAIAKAVELITGGKGKVTKVEKRN